MISDYKGEKPNNVITKEEHRKRPFFKKASFWILSVLGLFFGACTIYGLVLGYQYVEAVRDAAHIIADANGSEVDSANVVPLKPLARQNTTFNPPENKFDFTYNLDATYNGGAYAFNLYTGEYSTSTSSFPTAWGDYQAVIFRRSTYVLSFGLKSPLYTTQTLTGCNDSSQNQAIGKFYNHFLAFTAQNETSRQSNMINVDNSSITPITGSFVFSRELLEGFGEGYNEGQQDGYQEGYNDGYQEGYDDGYQALAGVQNVRILFDDNFPTLNAINYSWRVDDAQVASGQIMLRPNQSAPVVNLTRPGGYAHKAELNIWSENDEPLVIAYGRHEGLVVGGTQTYIYDTYNKSNAYDWDSSFWYVPTYNPNAGFVIYSYGTAEQGYTNDYYFEFDPEHNDRAKTGIYADGYDQGYKDATESGTAYDNGHQDGYAEGYEDGKTIGIAQGESQAVGGQKALVNMFVTAFQQPFDQIYRFLNFNVLGLNILALFTALLTLSIGIIIIKKVI